MSKSIWPTKKLVEVCERYFSGVWGENPDERGNAFVVRVSDVKDEGIIDYNALPLRYVEEEKIPKYRLQNNDIVVVKSSGSKKKIISGKAALFIEQKGKNILASNFVLALRPNQKLVLPQWLLFYLNDDEAKEFIKKIISITTYPNLKPQEYLKMKIPLPPLNTQKQIVARVEELFEKIDKAKELRQKAHEETEQIFSSAVESAFSQVEKKWGMKKLSDICHIHPNKTDLKNVSNNLEVSFIPMAGVDDVSGSIIAQEKKTLGKVKKGYTYFKEDDVLFAKITPCMQNGKSAIAKNLINGIGFGSTEFHILRPLDKVLSKWIYFYIRQPWFREEAERHFTGTAGQQRVPQEFLEKTEIPLPPLSEQKKIVAYLDNLREKTEKLKQLQQNQSKELTELKQSILSKALK